MWITAAAVLLGLYVVMHTGVVIGVGLGYVAIDQPAAEELEKLVPVSLNQLMAYRGINVKPFSSAINSTYDEGWVPVGDGHEIYYSQAGNPDGPAVVFAHGGPGGGATPGSRASYDPTFYRIVIFDQRGAGKSRWNQTNPGGFLYENTMPKIVEDMEVLREHLNIDQWVVTGGSAGSTLSLLYAIKYPARVLALCIHGIFFGTRHELKWTGWYSTDIWADEGHKLKYLANENGTRYLSDADLVNFDTFVEAGYREVVTKQNEHLAYAMLSQAMYGTHLDPIEFSKPVKVGGENALRMAQIIMHMWRNRFGLPENYIQDNLANITDIPGFQLNGRYDTNTVAATAWNLHLNWPAGSLLLFTGAHADQGVYNRWAMKVIQSALKRWIAVGRPGLRPLITVEDFEENNWEKFREGLNTYYLGEGLESLEEQFKSGTGIGPRGEDVSHEAPHGAAVGF